MQGLFEGADVSQRALNYHLERQNVLASNVANVDTPGFRPMELTRGDLEPEADGTLPLRVTHPAHVGSGGLRGPFRLHEDQEQVVSGGNDVNTVSLEREMSKVAANHLRYEGAVRIVRRQLGMLRYAANDGQ